MATAPTNVAAASAGQHGATSVVAKPPSCEVMQSLAPSHNDAPAASTGAHNITAGQSVPAAPLPSADAEAEEVYQQQQGQTVARRFKVRLLERAPPPALAARVRGHPATAAVALQPSQSGGQADAGATTRASVPQTVAANAAAPGQAAPAEGQPANGLSSDGCGIPTASPEEIGLLTTGGIVKVRLRAMLRRRCGTDILCCDFHVLRSSRPLQHGGCSCMSSIAATHAPTGTVSHW